MSVIWDYYYPMAEVRDINGRNVHILMVVMFTYLIANLSTQYTLSRRKADGADGNIMLS
jgi:hypothetical protein